MPVQKSKQLRKTVFEMCVKAGTGHISSCFSAIEIMESLYYHVLRPDDKFILSKGHASPLLAAILADKGVIDQSELEGFAVRGGNFGVHASRRVPGVEITSGSLGHGLGIATGMAMAKTLNNETGKVYCLMGDGETCEGSVWESAIFAGSRAVDNLVVLVDNNGLMVTDPVVTNIADLFQAAGFDSYEVDEGHDVKAITEALGNVGRGAPQAFIFRTVKGKGIRYMEGVADWHWRVPEGKEIDMARRYLD